MWTTHVARRAPLSWLWIVGVSAAWISAGCTSSPGTAADAGTTPSSGKLQLGAASATVVESAGHLTVSVSRIGGSSGAVSVHVDSADGTAHAGEDYGPLSTTVSFADGEVGPKTVDLSVANDTAVEGTETFTVRLSAPSGGAALGTPTSATISILDDDGAGAQGFGLNDTGVTGCATTSAAGLPCASPDAGTSDFPGQDGENGRDVTAADDRDGHAGFSFLKLDGAGVALPDQSVGYATTPWACVADRVTGLVWEVRTTDGGLRDRRWTYSWYASSGLRGGARRGTSNGGTCSDTSSCDTAKYVAAVNATGLCGASDWRLPTRAELLSLVDYGAGTAPLIDLNFLPDGSSDTWWSATPDWTGKAWVVDFETGATLSSPSEFPNPVRLVRRGG
ncbi:MAG TPA: DUF1566 domain-containing protein [Myxococcaceae bacterium]|nr:DUF1566 domain-containing protein [Myxococcaceae bacterium]